MDNKDEKQDFEKEDEYEIIVNNFRKKLHELPEEEWKKYSREVGKPVFNDFLDIVIFDKRDFDFNHRDGLKKWLKFNENKMPIDYLKLRITHHKIRLDRLNKLKIEDVVNYINKDNKPGLEEVTKNHIVRFKKNKIAHRRIIEWLEDELLLLERDNKNEINIDLSDTKGTEREYPFYCQIGALFAQGYISKQTNKGIGTDYYYKEIKFETISGLSKYVKESILKTKKNTRQIIDATLKDVNKEKNFYQNKTMFNNTISYCNKNNIKILEGFKLHK